MTIMYDRLYSLKVLAFCFEGFENVPLNLGNDEWGKKNPTRNNMCPLTKLLLIISVQCTD